MGNKNYPERRATLLFCFSAFFVAVGFIGWSFLPRPSFWQLLSQTPQTAGAYFTKFHRGSKQSQVEDWLAFHGLNVECSEKFRLDKTIYVRVKTKPETLVMIEFDHGRFSQAYGFPYEGVCPPPLPPPVY